MILLFNPIRNSQMRAMERKKSTKKEAATWQLCVKTGLLSRRTEHEEMSWERLEK